MRTKQFYVAEFMKNFSSVFDQALRMPNMILTEIFLYILLIQFHIQLKYRFKQITFPCRAQYSFGIIKEIFYKMPINY